MLGAYIGLGRVDKGVVGDGVTSAIVSGEGMVDNRRVGVDPLGVGPVPTIK